MTVIEYGTAWPGMSPARLFVLTIERSERREIVSDSPSVLLEALPSTSPAGAVTVALAERVAPPAAGLTQPLKVSVSVSPEARSRAVQFGAIVVALNVPWVVVKKPPTRLIVPATWTRSTRDGPEFVTAIV